MNSDMVNLALGGIILVLIGWNRRLAVQRCRANDTLEKELGTVQENQSRLETDRAKFLDSEARRQALLESALDCIITIDGTGTIIEFNAAAERIFGFTDKPALGRPLAELIAPTAFGKVEPAALVNYFTDQNGQMLGKRVEMTGIRASGTEFPLELILTRVRAVGPPIFTGYFREITDRMKGETALFERANQAALNVELNRALAGNDGLRANLQRCAEALIWHIGVAQTRIWTTDESGERLDLQAAAGLDSQIDGASGHLSLLGSYFGRLAQEGRPEITHTLSLDAFEPAERLWLAAQKISAYAVHPMLVDQRVVGMLALYDNKPLPEGLLTNLAAIADTVLHFVERAKAEAHVRQQQTELLATNQRLAAEVSDRAHVAESLQATNARLGALIANLQGAILVEDEQRRVVLANREFCSMFGVPVEPESLLGTDYSQSEAQTAPLFTNPDQFLSRVEEILRARITVSAEELTMSDGRVLARDYVPIFVGDTFSGHLWKYDDITKQKRIEHELSRLSLVARGTDNAVVITDLDGRITWVNEGFTRLTEYTLEEARGLRPGAMLQGLETDPVTVAKMREGVRDGRGFKTEVVNYTKSGKKYWVSIEVQPLHDVTGKFDGFMAIENNITARHEAEEELRAAKDAAERASRTKSEFLAAMSHEIRTPMNGIIGMAGLLLETQLEAKQRQYAEVVRNSGHALLTIINDILDFSKIEAGKMQIEPIPFNLLQAVEESLELLAPKAAAKSLEFALRIAPGTPAHVIGDPGRIRQILLNLVDNGIKFTQTGHILVEVSCRESDGERAQISLSVEDTGIGIPPDKQHILFDKFTQADASTSRKFGGTGLGLAISKRLAEMMGGEVGLESRPGNGSTFWFTVRLTLDKSVSETAPLAGIKPPRVLVVDDNLVCRRVMAERLNTLGARHTLAADANEAIVALRKAAAEGDPFGGAFIDFFMPGMNGEDLGRVIKGDPELRKTILVMVTSVNLRSDIERFEAAGFAKVVLKPIRTDDLIAALEQCSERTGAKAKPIVTTTLSSAGKEPELFPCRVLVAEDNVNNQLLACTLLERFGCRVDVAANGIEAVRMLESFAYDLIFMDCQMPEMDGYAAATEIRRREGTGRRVPIVAFTANAIAGDRENCIAAGMDDYISKPVSVTSLRNAVKRWSKPAATIAPVAPAFAPSAVKSIEPAPVIGLPVIELEQALDRLDGNRELFEHLARFFINRHAESFDRLRNAVAARDSLTVKMVAHGIKGSVGMLGASALDAAAARMEKAGAAEEAQRFPELLAQMEMELSRLLTTLNDHLSVPT